MLAALLICSHIACSERATGRLVSPASSRTHREREGDEKMKKKERELE